VDPLAWTAVYCKDLNVFAEDYWSLEAEGEYEKLLDDMLDMEKPEGRHIRRSSLLAMLES
jgi:hypothetical protein